MGKNFSYERLGIAGLKQLNKVFVAEAARQRSRRLQEALTGKTKAKARKSASKELACNFCSKTQSEVAQLIAGRNAYICTECIESAVEIYDDVQVSQLVNRKREAIKNKAIKDLKRVLKKGGIIYSGAAGTQALIIKGGAIIDISEAICNWFGKDITHGWNIADLSEGLFGSRKALRRKSL